MRPGLRWIPDQSFVPLNWVTAELLPRRMRRLLDVGELNSAEPSGAWGPPDGPHDAASPARHPVGQPVEPARAADGGLTATVPMDDGGRCPDRRVLRRALRRGPRRVRRQLRRTGRARRRRLRHPPGRGGRRPPRRGRCDPDRPWAADTITDFYSVGRPCRCCCCDWSTARGRPRRPDRAGVACRVAAGGKASATVRHALTHWAGVPAIPSSPERRRPVRLVDDDRGAGRHRGVVATGEQLAYHVNTFGHLVGRAWSAASAAPAPARPWPLLAGPLGPMHFRVPSDQQHAAPTRSGDEAFQDPGVRPGPPEGLNLLHALAHFRATRRATRRWGDEHATVAVAAVKD